MFSNNMSDGKTDGVVLMYNQKGIIYPIALSKDQMEMLDLTIGMALGGKIALIKEKPQGNAVNLLNK